MPSGINDDVREIIEELDSDGGGFRTGEAADMLVYRCLEDGVCEADGAPKPKVRTLMRIGAGVAIKGYRAFGQKAQRMREQAAERADSPQHDFNELSEDFDRRWLMTYAASEEGDDAARKMLLRMTLPEVLAVIALKRKKAAESTAVANQLQDIVDHNPSWRRYPAMTLADVLGIVE